MVSAGFACVVFAVRQVVKSSSSFVIHLSIHDYCAFVKEKASEQTLTQNEEADRQVDEDPGEPQELHQVVHEQVAFL